MRPGERSQPTCRSSACHSAFWSLLPSHSAFSRHPSSTSISAAGALLFDAAGGAHRLQALPAHRQPGPAADTRKTASGHSPRRSFPTSTSPMTNTSGGSYATRLSPRASSSAACRRSSRQCPGGPRPCPAVHRRLHDGSRGHESASGCYYLDVPAARRLAGVGEADPRLAPDAVIVMGGADCEACTGKGDRQKLPVHRRGGVRSRRPRVSRDCHPRAGRAAAVRDSGAWYTAADAKLPARAEHHITLSSAASPTRTSTITSAILNYRPPGTPVIDLSARDVSRMLVGRKAPLHVLQHQRRWHDVSEQVSAARRRRSQALLREPTRASESS